VPGRDGRSGPPTGGPERLTPQRRRDCTPAAMSAAVAATIWR
jgi:hypothetical protein